MCGRYTLANPDPVKLRRRFALGESAHIDETPRYNIAPTDPVLAIRRADGAQARQIGRLRWGLVPGHWAAKGSGRPLINARAETVATQPAFAESFRQRRCLIPADGFYEWRQDERGKRPVWIARPDGEPFAFAGVWAALERRDEGLVHSCAIVTCAPNELIRPIHDRMPAILPQPAEEAWLDPAADPDRLLGLLSPAPAGELALREVGDAVNDVRQDGPHLVEPREQAPGQAGLF